MFVLSKKMIFPPVESAIEDGIVAVGGDLSIERLILAYKSGIFPWYSDGEPIIWYSPDTRMVLFPTHLRVSKSMRNFIKKTNLKVTFNTNFKEVIFNCKNIKRKNQFGTWITNQMEEAYIKLHQIGVAKSFEVWDNKELVGGLYGVDLGNIFCGESMFCKVSNSSKLAFIEMVKHFKKLNYKMIDCQVYNKHLASLGAEKLSRKEFIKYLND